jgi:hypothetical protein
MMFGCEDINIVHDITIFMKPLASHGGFRKGACHVTVPLRYSADPYRSLEKR